MTPLFKTFGITRVADISGLDRIGVPVAIAVRPLSRSIAVAAGKAVDLAAAKLSAAMEAIECAHAEAIGLPLVLASREEILRSRRAVALDSLPLLSGHGMDDRARLLWIEGRDIVGGAAVMVPYELVHALNLWSRLVPVKRSERQVDLETICDPVANDAISRLTQAGFDITVWNITSNLLIPAFHCLITDTVDPGGHPIGANSRRSWFFSSPICHVWTASTWQVALMR